MTFRQFFMMAGCLTAGVLPLAPGASFLPQAAAQQRAKSSAQGEGQNSGAYILELTHEVLDAELFSDRAAMDRLFSDAYSHTHQSGLVQNKAEFMAEFAPGAQKYRIAEISDIKVRYFGSSAIVNGRENINDHHYLFLCVWVLEQGTWRMAA